MRNSSPRSSPSRTIAASSPLARGARRHLAVGVADRLDVPLPDPDAVGLADVEARRRHAGRRAAPGSPSPRRGRHRCWRRSCGPGRGCGRPRARRAGGCGPARARTGSSGRPAAAVRRAEQPLEDQPVLAHAQRAEADVALDHLAGARVDHAAAVGPAAGRAVDPLDDVVADVERVGALGQQLDAEGVAKARRLERRAPTSRRPRRRRRAPARGSPDRRSRRSARGPAESAAAGSRLASRWRTIQRRSMRLVERRRVVREADRERARARVEGARLVARVGQPQEGVVLHQGQRACRSARPPRTSGPGASLA